MRESTTIWIEQDALEKIFSKNGCSMFNLNIFKKDPKKTTYDWHNPVRVKMSFEYEAK